MATSWSELYTHFNVNRKCGAMNSVVISLQGTQSVDKQFICKELGVFHVSTGSLTSYHFLPPENVQVDAGVDSYVCKNLHGMPYESGELPYNCLAKLLFKIARGRCVLVKGIQHAKFLHSYDIHVHNLEEIGCPKATQLPDVTVTCPVEGHTRSLFCAQRCAIKFGKFLIQTMGL